MMGANSHPKIMRRPRRGEDDECGEEVPGPSSKRLQRDKDNQGSPFFEPTSRQLKLLWEYDNVCAKKYGTHNLRHCRADAEDDEGTGKGLSDFQMTVIKQFIDQTWRTAQTTLMVVGNGMEERPGLKLVAHPNLPKKLSLTDTSPLYCGWVVRIPEGETPVSHLWERSAVKKEYKGKEYNLYLGGAISYANCETASASTVKVNYGKCPGGAADSPIYQVKVTNYHGPLEPGLEITWEYNRMGPKEFQNFEAPPTWFLKDKCCYIRQKDDTTKRRHQRRSDLQNQPTRLWLDMCPLCGVPLAHNNKESRVQLKPHLVRSHPDYLGSEWNGYGTYNDQPIDGHLVLKEADLLNTGLNFLSHDLKARVMPACAVFKPEELEMYCNHPKKLMQKFRDREKDFVRAGCLILRGLKRVRRVRDFQLIKPTVMLFKDIKFASNRINRDQFKVPAKYYLEHQLNVRRMQKRVKKLVSDVKIIEEEQVDVLDLGEKEDESDSPEEEEEEPDSEQDSEEDDDE